MKSFRCAFMLLFGLCLAAAALSGQNTARSSESVKPKYRTHFMVYDVQNKTTKSMLTAEGEWHAPNWTPDGKYIISDMGGDLYRIPVSGAQGGKPEKIKILSVNSVCFGSEE